MKLNKSWQKIKHYKMYVIFSNLLLIPWFFIGMLISQSELFIGIWIILFLIIFKLPLFFLIKKLTCPVCNKQFVSAGMSLAFLNKCESCGSKIGEQLP